MNMTFGGAAKAFSDSAPAISETALNINFKTDFITLFRSVFPVFLIFDSGRVPPYRVDGPPVQALRNPPQESQRWLGIIPDPALDHADRTLRESPSVRSVSGRGRWLVRHPCFPIRSGRFGIPSFGSADRNRIH